MEEPRHRLRLHAPPPRPHAPCVGGGVGTEGLPTASTHPGADADAGGRGGRGFVPAPGSPRPWPRTSGTVFVSSAAPPGGAEPHCPDGSAVKPALFQLNAFSARRWKNTGSRRMKEPQVNGHAGTFLCVSPAPPPPVRARPRDRPPPTPWRPVRSLCQHPVTVGVPVCALGWTGASGLH